MIIISCFLKNVTYKENFKYYFNNIVKDVTGINLEDDDYYCLNAYLEADDNVVSFIEEDLYNSRIDD